MMDAKEIARLRALREAADLDVCEAFRDENTELWTVRRVPSEQGEIVAEVLWTDIEPLRDCGVTEARAKLFAMVGAALPALLDAAERGARAERELAEARAEAERLRAWQAEVRAAAQNYADASGRFREQVRSGGRIDAVAIESAHAALLAAIPVRDPLREQTNAPEGDA